MTYTAPARALHWVMALAIIPMLLFGEQTMGDHAAGWLPTVHASAGLVIFALLIARVAWRLRSPPPAALHDAAWLLWASRIVHGLLYLAMLLLPLTGWLAYTEHVRRSFGEPPATWFGYEILLLPDFAINWHRIHNWGGKLVLALIVLHIAAALKHHFYDHDETLRRML